MEALLLGLAAAALACPLMTLWRFRRGGSPCCSAFARRREDALRHDQEQLKRRIAVVEAATTRSGEGSAPGA